MTDPSITKLIKIVNSLQNDINTLKKSQSTNQLNNASIIGTSLLVVDSDGETPLGTIGQQTDGTFGIVATNGTTPPVPTDPIVAGGVGSIAVSWDGNFVGALQPANFSHINIYISSTPITVVDSSMLKGAIDKQGTLYLGPYSSSSPQYVVMTSVSLSGAESSPTDQEIATPLGAPAPGTGETPATPSFNSVATVVGFYFTGQSGENAQIALQWTQVTKNQDGSTITDLDHYEIRYSFASEVPLYTTWGALTTAFSTWGSITGVNWSMATATLFGAGQSVRFDAFADPPTDSLPITNGVLQGLQVGTAYDIQIRAVNTSGTPSAWSSLYTVVVGYDNRAPSQPSAPTLNTYAGGIQVVHNLSKQGGDPFSLEADTTRIEVYMSTNASFVASSSTLVGAQVVDLSWFRSSTNVVVDIPLNALVQQWVGVCAVDSSGNRSIMSTVVSSNAAPFAVAEGFSVDGDAYIGGVLKMYAPTLIQTLNLNSDFEDMISPWTTTGCSVSQDNSFAFNGNYSAKLVPDGVTAAPYMKSEVITGIVAGKLYSFTCEVYAPTGSILVSRAVTFRNSSHTIIGTTTYSTAVSVGQAWQELWGNVTAPAGAVEAYVQVVYNTGNTSTPSGTPTSSQIINVDNASFAVVPFSNTNANPNLYTDIFGALRTDGNLTVGGNITTPNPIFVTQPGWAFAAYDLATDTFPRIAMDGVGKIEFGPGTSATDTDLYRSGVGALTTDGSLTVGGELVTTTDSRLLTNASPPSTSSSGILTYAGTDNFLHKIDSISNTNMKLLESKVATTSSVQTIATSTLTNVTGLSLALTAGSYKIELCLPTQQTVANGSCFLHLGLTISATALFFAQVFMGAGPTTVQPATIGTASGTSANVASGLAYAATSTWYTSTMLGNLVTTGISGTSTITLNVQASCTTLNTIQTASGAFLIATRIA